MEKEYFLISLEFKVALRVFIFLTLYIFSFPGAIVWTWPRLAETLKILCEIRRLQI